MPLTVQQHQGLHGEGFVFALASAAGLVLAQSNLDVDGVDWLIAHPGPMGVQRSPKIEVQVKTWSTSDGDEKAWRYRMSVAHFNMLAGPGFELRRYLVLVTVPKSPDEYAVCNRDAMRLGHAAYWTSLRDEPIRPPSDARGKSVVVAVPKQNILTADTLKALVRGDHTGATL